MIPLATDPRVQERAERYKAFTLPALYRCSEQADEDLTALYRAFARLDLAMDDIILALPTLLSPTECEAVFLDIPLAATGFDRSMAWVGTLPEAAKRRLLMAAAEVWAAKGTGWRDLLNAIVGGRAWLGEWAALRDVVGDPAGELLALTEADAGTTFAHHTNPDSVADSVIDGACNVVRGVNQSLLRQDAMFLDDFAHGLSQWEATVGTSVPERGRLVVGGAPACFAKPIVALTEAHQVHARMEFSAGKVARLRTYRQEDDHGYELVVTPGGFRSVLVMRDTAGGTLGTAYVDCHPCYTYSIRVTHFAEAGGTRVQVQWEGSRVIDALAASGYTPGSFWFSADANATVNVRLVEVLATTVAGLRHGGRRR